MNENIRQILHEFFGLLLYYSRQKNHPTVALLYVEIIQKALKIERNHHKFKL
jgi:hypothetical protein